MAIAITLIAMFLFAVLLVGYEVMAFIGAGEEEYADGEFLSDEEKDAK